VTDPRGQSLFEAWREERPPAFDEGAGRARFLERFAETRSPWWLRHGLAAAAAVLLLCGAAFGAWRWTAPVTFTTTADGGGGATRGAAGEWLATGPSGELPLTFSEGSRLVMTAGSRGRVEELRRAGASFLLERGHVQARVTHRASTDWRFVAGPFEVRVTGTAFGVDWDPTRERFAVHVEEGSVVVRGPDVGESQVVGSGTELVVDVPSHTTRTGPRGVDASSEAGPPQSLPGPEDSLDAAGAIPSSGRAAAPHAGAAPGTASWLKLEEQGDFDGAYAAARSAGLRAVLRSASADELLRLAQVARLSGHRDTEREALVTCRRRFAGAERASVAAYELGQSSSPGEASRWFEAYLSEQPGGPLAREASGRLIEARAAAGDDAAARDAATQYLARYPGGPHAPLARRVLAGARE
jgi:transmembrane sensor